ncbi:DUF6262 family protein [Paraclostridium ghonii]|uniref:CRISPR/Cas system-associated protein Cas5 (RAMP superfamily) n=1 Tax=Paraclostridium ghonii TaxID=29358 RepID=A0ABU0MXC4_9FIRM|nr:DUF6262 family protein [Paeniclostridium ghonii]MDQ0555491.1 CRISPR/Cas system-associated protein Cas5 (RAMP superfamily) [Paeniclostridium ghonii]
MNTDNNFNHVSFLWNIAERLRGTYKEEDNTKKKTIQRLIKSQSSINFNNVANESGVSKKTLYDNKDIRERIETLRHQQSQVPTPSQVKREMDDNNKDAIIASLKRKIKRLEEENKELKEQLKVNYADIYKQL